jgi:hypothetical protein
MNRNIQASPNQKQSLTDGLYANFNLAPSLVRSTDLSIFTHFIKLSLSKVPQSPP